VPCSAFEACTRELKGITRAWGEPGTGKQYRVTPSRSQELEPGVQQAVPGAYGYFVDRVLTLE
jgi:hypothetical protein